MNCICRFTVALITLIFVFACSNEVMEKQRIPNASGTIDAIIAIRETGATVVTPTEIYVVRKGEKPSGNPIFRADNVEGLAVTWSGDSTVIIQADKARVFLQTKNLSVDAPGKMEFLVKVQLVIKDLS